MVFLVRLLNFQFNKVVLSGIAGIQEISHIEIPLRPEDGPLYEMSCDLPIIYGRPILYYIS